MNAVASAWGQISTHILSFWGLGIHSILLSTELELQVCARHSAKSANKLFQHIKCTNDPGSDDFDTAQMKTARAGCPFKAVKTVPHQEKKPTTTEIVTMQMLSQLKYTLL